MLFPLVHLRTHDLTSPTVCRSQRNCHPSSSSLIPKRAGPSCSRCEKTIGQYWGHVGAIMGARGGNQSTDSPTPTLLSYLPPSLPLFPHLPLPHPPSASPSASFSPLNPTRSPSLANFPALFCRRTRAVPSSLHSLDTPLVYITPLYISRYPRQPT